VLRQRQPATVGLGLRGYSARAQLPHRGAVWKRLNGESITTVENNERKEKFTRDLGFQERSLSSI